MSVMPSSSPSTKALPLYVRLESQTLTLLLDCRNRTPALLYFGKKLTAATPAPAGTGAAVDPEVVRLLIDAYDEAKRDERGFVALGPVGQRVGNRSSFDVRNYGFKRLSDLIAAIPNFTTEVREGGQTWIKRIR